MWLIHYERNMYSTKYTGSCDWRYAYLILWAIFGCTLIFRWGEGFLALPLIGQRPIVPINVGWSIWSSSLCVSTQSSWASPILHISPEQTDFAIWSTFSAHRSSSLDTWSLNGCRHDPVASYNTWDVSYAWKRKNTQPFKRAIEAKCGWSPTWWVGVLR